MDTCLMSLFQWELAEAAMVEMCRGRAGSRQATRVRYGEERRRDGGEDAGEVSGAVLFSPRWLSRCYVLIHLPTSLKHDNYMKNLGK